MILNLTRGGAPDGCLVYGYFVNCDIIIINGHFSSALSPALNRQLIFSFKTTVKWYRLMAKCTSLCGALAGQVSLIEKQYVMSQ